MAKAEALKRARIIKKVMLKYGVPEVSIELVEGRPTSGDPWNACQPVCVMSHHIASHPTPANPTPGLALVTQGRIDLAGPLCNGTAGVDLVYRIKTLGYANHPGVGGPMTVAGPLGAYGIPEDIGRPYIWGTEYEGGYTDAVWDQVYTNERTGLSMSFREFMGRANGALCEAIWLINGKGKKPTADMDLATYHVEHGNPWAMGRKPDRRGYVADLDRGRDEIRKYKSQGDDFMIDRETFQKWVANTPVPKLGGKAGAEHALKWSVAQARQRATTALAVSKAAMELEQRNRVAIAALGTKLDEVAPGVRQAVLDALGDEITVTIDFNSDEEATP